MGENAKIHADSIIGGTQGNSSPIIESGSNGNGQWTKFYDGTLICTYKLWLNQFRQDNGEHELYRAWTFPYRFASLYGVQVTLVKDSSNETNSALNARAVLASNSWTDIVAVRPGKGLWNGASVQAQVVAFGKWK